MKLRCVCQIPRFFKFSVYFSVNFTLTLQIRGAFSFHIFNNSILLVLYEIYQLYGERPCKNMVHFINTFWDFYRIWCFWRYFYWIKSFMSSNASCMSSTSSCIPLSAIVKSFKSLKSNSKVFSKTSKLYNKKFQIENLKQSQSLFWFENIWNVRRKYWSRI